MYVCLCAGVTNQTVANAVDAGATTSGQVADACGAGRDCGRCRRTVRAIIDSRRDAGGPRQGPVGRDRRSP